MNALIEQSSRAYRRRMEGWIEIALEEGVRFFVTSLGNPRWVVDRVAPVGGVVYHDATERRWGAKGVDGGVHGLVAVNDRAGGHAGGKTAEALLDDLGGLGVPLLLAGGVGAPADFARALAIGYAGVQMGTRFIASAECRANDDYKEAIVAAVADDIVLTERLTGVPVAVIRNGYVRRLGTRAGPVARLLLRTRRTKHLMRTIYALRALRRLKRDSVAGAGRGETEYWQAGRSVDGIHSVESVAGIIRQFRAALD